ncbi:MAG: c-type cytochrome biogenesis protein CcmI [Aestuariivirga sp.]|nr:c-type cytochrome biogenesis protein CcmI [Aestuariivirga sp.]
MLIWLIFAGMTAAVVAALLVPFMRKSADAQSPDSEFDRAIYRDQLLELDRDAARGLIGATEAQAARNEISRRLLQVANPETATGGSRYALLAVLLVPLIALPIYAKFGSPLMPDVPLQERMKGAITNQDFEALVATVEAHLAEVPNDVEGWKVLAPAYKRERRWSDAADAYANVLRLAPPSADAIADYGEMLVFANEGMVTDEAESAFAEALKLEATNERAKYYYDMALKQEGKAPALSDEQIAAGQAMSTQDQTAMIAGMMDGLEQKLGKDSRDLEGWKRLIRARRITNEIDKAKISLDLATNIFKDEPATLDALRALAGELGIN